MADDCLHILIEAGTNFIRGGYAGDDAPLAVIPNIVGKSRHIMLGMGGRDFYVGDEAMSKRGILNMSTPMEDGIITDFDNFEKLLHHTFYSELRRAPEEHVLVMTQKAWNPDANKTKTTQMVFETFNVPAFYLADEAPLNVFAGSGKVSGLSLNLGYQSTSAVAVYEGSILPYTLTHTSYGGKDLWDYMVKMVSEENPTTQFTNTPMKYALKDVMEKYCFVAESFEESVKIGAGTEIEKEYELPDGEIIKAKSSRVRCPEAFFNPELLGKGHLNLSLPNLVEFSIQKLAEKLSAGRIDFPGMEEENSMFAHVPEEIRSQIGQFVSPPPLTRRNLWQNIVMEGGPSFFPGLEKRLHNELTRLAPGKPIRFLNPAETDRKYNVFIGGSIFASLSSFEKQLMTKDDYDESGPNLALQKFY